MKIFIETDRLILREILPSDDEGLFEMDSDPEVHKYLEPPIETIEQARGIIAAIRMQYVERGIGRWAIVEKGSDTFIGWTGLKLVTAPKNNHVNYYDLGYRLQRKYWGKGFATEAALPCVEYAFTKLPVEILYGDADMNNIGSRNVLEKSGLRFVETFDHEGYLCGWYKLEKDRWLASK